jgi:hypothetical protein
MAKKDSQKKKKKWLKKRPHSLPVIKLRVMIDYHLNIQLFITLPM